MLQGPAGRNKRNGGTNPFDKMRKAELLRECGARGLPNGDLKKDELEEEVKDHLKGVKRIPALLFSCQTSQSDDIGLKGYDVLSSESLRDLKEHIKNILEEIKHHPGEQELEILNQVLESTIEQKDKVRGCD